MFVKNYLKNLISNKYLMMSICFTVIIIAAILVLTFTPFKELPFIYNEF
ncbi:hypothetical protein GCM10008917_21860 [Paraclostridium tenue]|uniref:Oligopeptide transport permease C-like N-terminal domain-containing protein n=1 Tax=Paraclostridium tenue TaxID=1737 RepID=A0ABN1M7C8_9FIRM